MVWSQFSIRILEVHFGNSVLDSSYWDKTNDSLTKKSMFGTECNSLREEKQTKEIVYQILLTLIHTYTIPKFIKTKIEKKQYKISSGTKKHMTPRHLARLSIWKCGSGILDIDIN